MDEETMEELRAVCEDVLALARAWGAEHRDEMESFEDPAQRIRRHIERREVEE